MRKRHPRRKGWAQGISALSAGLPNMRSSFGRASTLIPMLVTPSLLPWTLPQEISRAAGNPCPPREPKHATCQLCLVECLCLQSITTSGRILGATGSAILAHNGKKPRQDFSWGPGTSQRRAARRRESPGPEASTLLAVPQVAIGCLATRQGEGPPPGCSEVLRACTYGGTSLGGVWSLIAGFPFENWMYQSVIFPLDRRLCGSVA